jgi:hypothetical protein
MEMVEGMRKHAVWPFGVDFWSTQASETKKSISRGNELTTCVVTCSC